MKKLGQAGTSRAARDTLFLAAWMIPILVLQSLPALAEDIELRLPNVPIERRVELFGTDMANVGDQNGDGFDDFLIGMETYEYHGAAFLYYGGPLLDAIIDMSFLSDLSGYYGFGRKVSALGDINVDGFPDFAIGQNGSTNQSIEIYYGGPGLDTEPEMVIAGIGILDHYSDTLSGGRDINGDGYPDLVAIGRELGSNESMLRVWLGGPGFDSSADIVFNGGVTDGVIWRTGEVVEDVTGDGYDDLAVFDPANLRCLVYAGGPLFDAEPDWSWPMADMTPAYFSVAAGDLDGDGFADLVVGDGSAEIDREGRVYVFRGGPHLDEVPEATLHGLRFTPDGATDNLYGRMVAVPGDLDGDGFKDLVAASGMEPAGNKPSFMYVYRGGDLSQLDLALVMDRPAATRGTHIFASAVLSEGDPDGDGKERLFVAGDYYHGNVWLLDELHFDCNRDDIPDQDQVAAGELQDCDEDDFPDLCRIQMIPTQDCDANGILDYCELEARPEEVDCNGDGKLDVCQMAANPGLDCDGNGNLDTCDWVDDLVSDCDGDGVYDACQFLQDPSLDSDGSQRLDVCEPLGELILYADADHTTREIVRTASGPVGPFELVLRMPPGASAIERLEVGLEPSDGLVLLNFEFTDPDAFDVDSSVGGILLLSDLSPGPDGEVVLGRVDGWLANGWATDLEIRIRANTSVHGTPGTHRAIWYDEAGDMRVLLGKSGWVNRTFLDCNDNDRDDVTDITEGSSSDYNANLVPDECEATATPPAVVVPRLQIRAAPNPFNPSVTFRVSVPHEGTARVDVFDLRGRRVWTGESPAGQPGEREIVWRGRDSRGREVTSGVYVARVVQGEQSATCKVALVE